MSNRLVKGLGIAIAVIAPTLLVAGVTLEHYTEVHRDNYGNYSTNIPYGSLGNTLVLGGWAMVVLGCAMYVAGVFVKPSIRELRSAKRMIERNKERLHEDIEDNDAGGSTESQRTEQSETTKFCRHCGSVVPIGSAFCEHCGKRL